MRTLCRRHAEASCCGESSWPVHLACCVEELAVEIFHPCLDQMGTGRHLKQPVTAAWQIFSMN